MVTEPKRRDKDERGRFTRGNRAAVKSGCHSYLVKGKIPAIRGTRGIQKQLDKIRKELEASIPNLDIKSTLLIDSLVKAHGYSLLFEAYARRLGIFSIKGGELNYLPGFAIYQTFMNLQRHLIRQLKDAQDHSNQEPLTITQILEQEEKSNDIR